MAVKNEYDPNAKGLRGVLRKNFGQDEEGRSYPRHVAEAIVNTYTAGAYKENKGAGPVVRVVVPTLGFGMFGIVTTFFSGMGHLMYDDSFDGTLVGNLDYVEGGDVLENAADMSGYLITDTGASDGYYMLERHADGDFTLYEGARRGSSDITFSQVDSPDEAAFISHTLAQSYGTAIDFPEHAAAVNYEYLDFERLSLPFEEEGREGVTVRALDEPFTVDMTANFETADLQTLWAEASAAFRDGNAQTYDPLLVVDNPLKSAVAHDDGWYHIVFTGLGVIGGLGLAGGAISGVVQSRRRHRYKGYNL